MKKKQSWIVTVRCIIIKEIETDNCTAEEARKNPFDHSVNETELEQQDWYVDNIEPNN